MGARQDRAQLEKDELQFRHEVGELSDGELAAKIVEPQHVLDQCARDRKELDASRSRFVEAIGLEEALEADEPTPAPAPAAAAPTPAAAASASPRASASASPPAAAAAGGAAPAAQPASASPAPSAQEPAVTIAPARSAPPPAAGAKPLDEDPGETRVSRPAPDPVQATRTVAGAAPAPKAAAPAPAAPQKPVVDDGVAEGATVMVATAAIVVDGAGGEEYPLTVLNGIGRSEDNRICVLKPGISRKHAVITAADGAFVIRDLGSQNGTFVNGQRITERKLVAGDTIEVGSVKFVFRSPWPPRGGAAAREDAAAQVNR